MRRRVEDDVGTVAVEDGFQAGEVADVGDYWMDVGCWILGIGYWVLRNSRVIWKMEFSPWPRRMSSAAPSLRPCSV